MKKKEKAYSMALASTFIIFLIFVSSAAAAPIGNGPHNFTIPEISSGAGDLSDDQVVLDGNSTLKSAAATASTVSAAPKITEKRITTNASEQYDPIIYGNRIVWTDYRNGNADVYIYDLSTKKEPHTTNVSDQYSPDIYDNRVVWEDDRNGGSDIYLQDLSTKKQTRIITSGVASVLQSTVTRLSGQVIPVKEKKVTIFTCTTFPPKRKLKSLPRSSSLPCYLW